MNRALEPRASRHFWTAAAIVGLALAASATPTPLYARYRILWHFSLPRLTVAYAAYAAGVLAALILTASLSDNLVRRPVLIAGQAGLILATITLATAQSLGWLVLGRGLQGLSTGVVLAAAGSALLDLATPSAPAHAGLVNGIASALGIGLGALVSAELVQHAPAPRVVPCAMLLVGEIVLVLLTLRLPDLPSSRSGRIPAPRWPKIFRGK